MTRHPKPELGPTERFRRRMVLEKVTELRRYLGLEPLYDPEVIR